jgi:hypothetical protein
MFEFLREWSIPSQVLSGERGAAEMQVRPRLVECRAPSQKIFSEKMEPGAVSLFESC